MASQRHERSANLLLSTDISTLVLHQVHLGIEDESMVGDTFPTSFPHLRRLDLIDPELYTSFLPDWTSFLKPEVFPNLSQLSLVSDNLGGFGGHSFCDALASIAHQLETLTFDEGGMEPWPQMNLIWNRFSHLKHLSLRLWRDRYLVFVPALNKLPSPSLVTLQIVCPTHVHERADTVSTVGQLLCRAPATLSALKTIILRGWPSWVVDPLDPETCDLFEEWVSAIEKFLGTEGSLEKSEEWEDWEEQINWW